MAANGDECSMVALDNSSPNRVAFPKVPRSEVLQIWGCYLSGHTLRRQVWMDAVTPTTRPVFPQIAKLGSRPQKTLQNSSEPVTDQHVPGTSK